jgi:TPP-dependent 2-oxoacid decarboxylase
MSAPLSCSQALLNEIDPKTPTTWTEAFDKVLRDTLEQCRPGYVEIPTDAVHHLVSDDGLKKKLVSHTTFQSVSIHADPLNLASSALRPSSRGYRHRPPSRSQH